MSKQEYLNQILKLDGIINAKREYCYELLEMATRTSSFVSTEFSSGVKTSKIENAVTKLVDLSNEIDADIENLVKMKRKAIKIIDSVENYDYRRLLTLRYVNGWKWERIALAMNYSYVHVTGYLHKKALQEINVNEH